jgi:hypothetical protein
LEPLSDASFVGKLLVLPANVRLDWKVIARYKQSSLFGLVVSNEEKGFVYRHLVSKDSHVHGHDFSSDVIRLNLKKMFICLRQRR